MAFGGYKFKGYKVVRANLATNTYANWCLLVHQARIKAFMESCALSGAQWHFSKTNGALSFESYGNVIYRVADAESNYTNYMSFFQYGSEDAYYMIATLGGCTSETSFNQTRVDMSGIKAIYWSSVYSYLASLSSALSLSDFTEDGIFANYPASALFCSSVMCDEKVLSSSAIIQANSNEFAVPKSSTIYIGFATKGKDIITISTNMAMSNPFSFCVESIGGLSQMCSPTDEKNVFKALIRSRFTNEGHADINPTYINGGMCDILKPNGARFGKSRLEITSSSGAWGCAVIPPSLPIFTSLVNHIPYASPALAVSKSPSLSDDKFSVKGSINSELVSYNMSQTSSSNCPSQGVPVMGGNLISVGPLSGSQYTLTGSGAMQNTGISLYPCGYVGWDPSNPNINDESSWPELALQ